MTLYNLLPSSFASR